MFVSTAATGYLTWLPDTKPGGIGNYNGKLGDWFGVADGRCDLPRGPKLAPMSWGLTPPAVVGLDFGTVSVPMSRRHVDELLYFSPTFPAKTPFDNEVMSFRVVCYLEGNIVLNEIVFVTRNTGQIDHIIIDREIDVISVEFLTRHNPTADAYYVVGDIFMRGLYVQNGCVVSTIDYRWTDLDVVADDVTGLAAGWGGYCGPVP